MAVIFHGTLPARWANQSVIAKPVGSACWYTTAPPDANWRSRVTAAMVGRPDVQTSGGPVQPDDASARAKGSRPRRPVRRRPPQGPASGAGWPGTAPPARPSRRRRGAIGRAGCGGHRAARGRAPSRSGDRAPPPPAPRATVRPRHPLLPAARRRRPRRRAPCRRRCGRGRGRVGRRWRRWRARARRPRPGRPSLRHLGSAVM